jgi:hypothetical protein
MEMGRKGLRALLSMLRWDIGVSAKKLQVASLVALINLMMAAYPIMPHHGGKIMSELLACWGHANRILEDRLVHNDQEKELCEMCKAITVQVSGLALVLCGARAEEVLRVVEEDGGYEESLVHLVGLVRDAATNVKKTLDNAKIAESF